MNKVIIIGNLTRDNVIRYTQGGMAFLNQCVAINEKQKNANGEYQTKTTFIDVAFFGRMAENVNQYLRKGSKILVEGKIDISEYQTQDGQNRRAFKIIAENMEMLGSPNNDNQKQKSNNNANNANNNHYQQADKYEQDGGVIPF